MDAGGRRAAPPATAPWWLRRPTGQTIWARLAWSLRLVRFTREALPTPAEDDRFFSPEGLSRARAAASSSVQFQVTSWSGHTGFVSGPWRAHHWAEEMAIAWLGRAGQRPVWHRWLFLLPPLIATRANGMTTSW